MYAPVSVTRGERGASAPRFLAAARAATADANDLTPDQQAQIATQHAAFDYETAERAELLREHDILQAMLMEQLKNDDEIVKKWIALI